MVKVSVVMPAYNSEKTIADSISSVLNQTFNDFELLIVDDCSRDNTLSVIKQFALADSRVFFHHNTINIGVSETRNYAIQKATGQWIAFLDSDDIWAARKLDKQIALLIKNPDAVISYTGSSFIDSNGEPYDYIMSAEKKTSYQTLLRRNLLSCSSVIIRSDVMKSFKMPNDFMHEDYYIWLKVLKTYGYAYGIDEPLLIYRLSDNSKSSNRLKSARMIFNSYKAVGYGFFASSFFTLRYTIYSVSKRYKLKH